MYILVYLLIEAFKKVELQKKEKYASVGDKYSHNFTN